MNYNALLNEQLQTLNTTYNHITKHIDTLKSYNVKQSGDINGRLADLANEKMKLEKRLANLKNKEAAYNKEFQDIVYYPRDTQPETLQDFSIGIFAFGWFLLGALLVAYAIFQAEGSWKKGTVAATLFILITAIVISIFYMYL